MDYEHLHEFSNGHIFTGGNVRIIEGQVKHPEGFRSASWVFHGSMAGGYEGTTMGRNFRISMRW